MNRDELIKDAERDIKLAPSHRDRPREACADYLGAIAKLLLAETIPIIEATERVGS